MAIIYSVLMIISAPSWDEQCPKKEARVLIGQSNSAQTRKMAQKMTQGVVRWIRHGDAITEDYSPSRLNIEMNRRGKIIKIWCG